MYTLVCLLRAETPLKLFCIANLMLCVDMKGTGGESVLSESWMPLLWRERTCEERMTQSQ
jgi:hypothetical protein